MPSRFCAPASLCHLEAMMGMTVEQIDVELAQQTARRAAAREQIKRLTRQPTVKADAATVARNRTTTSSLVDVIADASAQIDKLLAERFAATARDLITQVGLT